MKKSALGFLVFFLAARLAVGAQNSQPTVQFSAANYTAIEGSGVANLTITKMGATTEPVTAYYKTRDGTARAPSDYTFTGDDLTASVRFEPSETSKDIQIPIRNDGYKEPDETFEVYFTVILGAMQGTPGTATVTIQDDDPQGPLPPARALNISTRAQVQTGERVLIAGFIIRGPDSKPVVLRALGPSLGQALAPTHLLQDPVLQLRAADGTLIAQNDNWKDDPANPFLLQGSPFAPKDDRESVIVASLAPGAYTAIMSGKNQTSGIGLVEAYDTNRNTESELANISTRGYVGMENDVMIGGFTLGSETGSVQIAIRGLGPSLATAGLHGVLLADPALELHDSNGAGIASNDDWQSDPVSAAQLTAHGLALPDEKEAGLFIVLPPGAYTAILNGKMISAGIGLVEIYNLK